jgi:glucosamine--fructose-6-phosphate aminotransferase (isomerizing)
LSAEKTSYADWFEIAVQQGISFPELRAYLDDGIERLLNHPKFRPNMTFWLTGSGDSLFAAQCVLPALQRWAGLRATALTSIEFARYRVPLLTGDDALWAISNSGSAARTRETVSLAKSKGIFTLGVTGSETGPLASTADTFLYRPVQDIPGIPAHNRGIFMNMNEFMVALYTLFYAGLRIGVANNALSASRADGILSHCEQAIRSVGEVARQIEPATIRMAEELKDLDTVWVIGAGPNFGLARYCAAKFHEQLPWNGIPEDLEEWAHLQYFLTLSWKSRSAVVVLAPPGNSLDRAEELVHGISDAGGRAYVVAHPGQGNFPDARQEFRLSGDPGEFLSAFTYHLPVQLFILHVARLSGQDPYALRRQDGYRLIRQGTVLDDANVLA